MRKFQVLIAIGVLLTLGIASGFELLFRVGYVLLGLLILSFVWSRLSLTSLKLVRATGSDRAQAGETLTEKFTIANSSFLPKLWVEVRDTSTLPGHHASCVVSLPRKGERSWRISTVCRRRGEYRLGPVALHGGDPFGFFSGKRLVGESRTLLVYPETCALPHLTLRLGQMTGGSVTRQIVQHVTPTVAGIRDYAPGDSYNRIHWPSTAKWQELMVKEFDLEPATDVWLVIDMERGRHAGQGDDSTEEYAVRAAAALGYHALNGGLAVGMMMHAPCWQIVMPDRGTRQLWKILEQLAVARAVGTVPLVEMLVEEAARFSRHTTLVAITPSPSTDWIKSASALSAYGVKTVGIVLDASTFGKAAPPTPALEMLTNARMPWFVINNGQKLAEALVGDGFYHLTRLNYTG